MIAISSFRPHIQNGEYRTNQIRAKQSWELVFDEIIYFGRFEPELASDKTRFIPCDGWPRICDMASEAAQHKGYTAIINADIVVSEDLKKVVQIMGIGNVAAATSRRRELETGILHDNDKGRDIFICKRKWWRRISHDIPKSCLIGHQQWDSWMVSYLRWFAKTRFADFTMAKCIFHPNHEGRTMPFNDKVDIEWEHKGYWSGRQDPIIAL